MKDYTNLFVIVLAVCCALVVIYAEEMFDCFDVWISYL